MHRETEFPSPHGRLPGESIRSALAPAQPLTPGVQRLMVELLAMDAHGRRADHKKAAPSPRSLAPQLTSSLRAHLIREKLVAAWREVD